MTKKPLTFETLDERRLELGMSKIDLAKRSGVSLSTVNRILSDKIDNVRMASIFPVLVTLSLGLRLMCNEVKN